MALDPQPGRGRGVSSRLAPWFVLALLLCLPALPVPPYWLTLANYAGIAAIIATGLVVLTGFGGMTSFAQATFMGFGAYATAILSTRYGVSPWLTLPVSLAAAGVAALAIGAITLRLSGHYLALGTLAWAVSFYYTFANLDFFGRNDGISGIPPLELAGVQLTDSATYFYPVWLGVALSVIATLNLLDSRVGRSIRALRGGALAASSYGVDLTWTRMLAFTYAAVLAGLAGWLYAHMQRSVNPTPFGLNASIEYLLMAVVGGAGSVWGALLGALLVTVLNDQLQNLLPLLLGSAGNYETIVFGALLVLILQAAPDGLYPLLRAGFMRKTTPRRSIAQAAALPMRAMPAPGAPVLEAEGLRRTFGGLVAVDRLDLALFGQEIVALIGPNGAGKSTTFNLLTGVTRPSAGSVRFLGRGLRHATPPLVARLGMGRTFQHVRLVPGMSVIENVALGAHLRGRAGFVAALLRLDRGEEARLFAEAARQLERVGLRAVANQPADSLALGQQRIVEIARARCLDPVLLLLDEPAAGLRHAEKVELATLLRELRDDGHTVLLVEHDMEFVMNLADRIVVMQFGTKLAEGEPDAIRADPDVIESYLGAVA
jgi:branched-chain amino acid transport system permease protein